MHVTVKGRNVSLTEALERYAREKVGRVARFFDDGGGDARAEVDLIHERNPANPSPEVADTTLFIGGTVLKAREESADMYASIDLASDKLERQVKRYRGRQLDRWHGKGERGPKDGAAPSVGEEMDDSEDLGLRIVRTKQFRMKPMSPEEAALQMELLDHAFFVFTSADTGDVNVVYRRRDGDYGLIEPAR